MLRQFRVLGLVFVATCVLGGGVLAMVSAAAPMQLPGFSNPSAGVSTSLASKLFVSGGPRISCQKGTDQLLFNGTSTNLGTFTIDFKECKQGSEPCTSLGDTSEVILLVVLC